MRYDPQPRPAARAAAGPAERPGPAAAAATGAGSGAAESAAAPARRRAPPRPPLCVGDVVQWGPVREGQPPHAVITPRGVVVGRWGAVGWVGSGFGAEGLEGALTEWGQGRRKVRCDGGAAPAQGLGS
jgi:hypothetical protein